MPPAGSWVNCFVCLLELFGFASSARARDSSATLRVAVSPVSDPETKRGLLRVERRLRELSLEYGLGSSQASLVSVVKRSGDLKDQIPRTRVVALGTLGGYAVRIAVWRTASSNDGHFECHKICDGRSGILKTDRP